MPHRVLFVLGGQKISPMIGRVSKDGRADRNMYSDSLSSPGRSIAPRIRQQTWLSELIGLRMNQNKCPCRHLMDGNRTILRVDEHLRVVDREFAWSRRAAGVLGVFNFPVAQKYTNTIAPPLAIHERAMYPVREVR
jgi:hypothetical protein